MSSSAACRKAQSAFGTQRGLHDANQVADLRVVEFYHNLRIVGFSSTDRNEHNRGPLPAHGGRHDGGHRLLEMLDLAASLHNFELTQRLSRLRIVEIVSVCKKHKMIELGHTVTGALIDDQRERVDDLYDACQLRELCHDSSSS